MQLHLNARERAPTGPKRATTVTGESVPSISRSLGGSQKENHFSSLSFFFAAMRQFQPKKCVRPEESNHVTGCHLQSEPFLRQRDVNRGHPPAHVRGRCTSKDLFMRRDQHFRVHARPSLLPFIELITKDTFL